MQGASRFRVRNFWMLVVPVFDNPRCRTIRRFMRSVHNIEEKRDKGAKEHSSAMVRTGAPCPEPRSPGPRAITSGSRKASYTPSQRIDDDSGGGVGQVGAIVPGHDLPNMFERPLLRRSLVEQGRDFPFAAPHRCPIHTIRRCPGPIPPWRRLRPHIYRWRRILAPGETLGDIALEDFQVGVYRLGGRRC